MPSSDQISRRSYDLWEKEGRPNDRHLDHWLQAERELQDDGNEPLRYDAGLAVSNLDRALPPEQRRQQRQAAHPPGNAPVLAAPEHFVVLFDRAYLRIFRMNHSSATGQAPQFELAEAFDFPAGKQRATARDTDQAGRRSSGRAGAAGASTDERLPEQNEHERRLVADIVEQLTRFFASHPDAPWDLAAGPALRGAVLDQLPPHLRQRLGRTVPKEFSRPSPEELREYFLPARVG